MAEATIVSAGPLARIDGIRGVVHAVFPSAAYIAVDDGPMLVVHGPAHGPTPTSLILDRLPCDGWGASAGAQVAGRLGHLRLGVTLLDGRHTRSWQPRQPLREGVSSAAEMLPAIQAAATAHLAPTCDRLVRSLAAGDGPEVDECVAAMVGSGPGLTPAGDDAIVGLLALLHRCAPRARGAAALRRLVPGLNARLAMTTPISAHYLRLALAGHFGQALTDLVDALGAARAPSSVEALVNRVRGTGASSGADALAGVAAGVGMLLRGPSTTPHRLLEETA
jgi:Protein of unknown function (DUF2877)